MAGELNYEPPKFGYLGRLSWWARLRFRWFLWRRRGREISNEELARVLKPRK